ncbi:Salicylate hydroxylase [Microbacterium esteraromaticum]|uniref:Salicylate hydroxylase n=1 Tax=Microbacterium esteraromaticum TaxID=57043 RepID=A0A1R4IIR2_9MICO|nr:NAD(P)/FAD-dependent oxidoreductase [Microbacterium esteraromaticum]SJN19700.1 Salicylate hydroxylase [Microbacterium esteraromaticum]
MADHEVIIAGAGPVGLMLGCLLAGRGIDVLVCDSGDGVDGRTRAIGLHPPGLAALDEAGVGEQIRQSAVRLEGAEVFARGRMLASVPLVGRREVLALPQGRTDAVLRGRLQQLGAAMRTGCEVRTVEQDGAVVRVQVVEEAMAKELTSSFFIAADGVRSIVRTQLGIPWLARPGRARYSMMDIPDPDAAPVARLFCEPAGIVESFPLPAGARRWVVRHTDDAAELSADSFVGEIDARTGIRITPPADCVPTGFTAKQHRAERAVHVRIALLGDAAHESSPIGGQGMNLGWVNARRLAERIQAALQSGGVLSGDDRRSARAVAAVQRRAHFYMSMGSPAAGVIPPARETLIRMLGSAPLRPAAAWLMTMGGL